jgi:SAM-dependent methyltransferase
MDVRTWVARQLILASQCTPFRGRGSYSAADPRRQQASAVFPQAIDEANRVEDFFEYFGQRNLSSTLAGLDVLDFGSGYGGRTVEYARRYGARKVWGVEPFANVVSASLGYAQSQRVTNVEFLQCGHLDIPLPDECVDIVLSYDVLEHVQDPRRSVSEIRRVLRPGGAAYLVFPVYFGALAHHLDYITMLPGLHWMFSADRLVAAVNSILSQGGTKRFGVQLQAGPKRSFDGARSVLPTLNGISGEHLAGLFRQFEIIRIARHSLLRRRQSPGRIMASLAPYLPTRLQDLITSSVSCALRKPEAAT